MRVEKDKNHRLKEQLRVIERNANQKHEHMMRMEANIKDLKSKLVSKRGTEEDQIFDSGITQLKQDEKIKELRRTAEVLIKNKDKDQRIMKQRQKTYEKNMAEINEKVEEMEELLKEKDKSIKAMALKLRELMNSDV